MMEQDDVSSQERGWLRGSWRWLAAMLTVLLTLGIVVGLTVFHRSSVGPVNTQKVGSASVIGIDFKCRLPVVTAAAAGFISFPDGAVSLDRRVAVDPYKNQFAYSYDAQLARWLPVPGQSVAPDGRSYAYLAQTTGVPGEQMSTSLHVHEISSGRDRVLWEAAGSSMSPTTVTWLSNGIYFSAALGGVGGPETALPSVYVSDPNHAGSPRRVGPNPAPPSPVQPDYGGPDIFSIFGGGAAWGMGNRVPKQAPSPNSPPAPGDYGPDRVLRLDLSNGRVSTWYTVSGTDIVSVLALDEQGRPILALFQPKPSPSDGTPSPKYEAPQFRLLLLTGPDQTADIASGNPDFHLGSTPLADSHGIWFGSWNGVWLYAQGAGLRQVATIGAGIFPSPSPPPGVQGKPGPSPAAPPEMPSYMQGTLVVPAGSCK